MYAHNLKLSTPKLSNSVLPQMLSLAMALLALLWGPALSAKSSDKNQPLQIQADKVEIRELEGTSTYSGNVKIDQGTLQISGDLIVIHNTEGTIQRILVTGTPASFRQLNDNDQVVSASAEKLEYLADDGQLLLQNQATLIQGPNRFTSDHIIYDTQQDIVQAGGNTEDPQQPERVSITIHPQPETQQEEPEPGSDSVPASADNHALQKADTDTGTTTTETAADLPLSQPTPTAPEATTDTSNELP